MCRPTCNINDYLLLKNVNVKLFNKANNAHRMSLTRVVMTSSALDDLIVSHTFNFSGTIKTDDRWNSGLAKFVFRGQQILELSVSITFRYAT